MVQQRISMDAAMAMAPISTTPRVTRSPQHQFRINQVPFAITPFMIAPVLAGETLNFMLLQTRSVSEALKSPLLGMWMEYYFFYVKHRDIIAHSQALQNMVMDINAPFTGATIAAHDAVSYGALGGQDWVRLCLDRVVQVYFRDEDEPVSSFMVGSYPACKIQQESWMQTMFKPGDVTFDDIDIDAPVDTVPTPDTASVKASELDKLKAQYEMLLANDLVEMTYEEWLMTYGVSFPEVEVNEPELLRYVRDWKLPGNMMAADAAPRYAISWQMAERADKRRRFTEPGFIFGVSVVRPKAYFKNQVGNALGFYNDAFAWLPAILGDDATVGLAQHATGAGPCPVLSTYGYDRRDLYIYGDQYANVNLATEVGFVTLPTNTTRKYPALTDAQSYFATAGKEFVATDGIVRLSILGHQRDTTP